MTEDDDSSLDIDVSGVIDTIVESANRLEEISQDEVMSFDITLINVRGKAQIANNAPVPVASEAVDYINEHVDEVVNKEMSTDTGVKIGEILISGDGEIVEARIENKYKND